MAEFVCFEDVRERRLRREMPVGHMYRTQFISHKETMQGPHVFMIESSANRSLETHFHDVDQFQVVVGGGGLLGRHVLAPYGVHFARGFTPYGPLVSGPGEGVTYITLRARRDPVPKAQKLTEQHNLDKLKAIPGRQPWQVTSKPEFPARPAAGVLMQPIAGLQDERGLAAWTLGMAPGSVCTGPSPAHGDGQCVVALEGDLVHQGVSKAALGMLFIRPEEGPLRIEAGARGLTALVLNFPLPVTTGQADALAGAPGAGALWQCPLCAFAYDPAAGLPAEGIPAGTPWEALPQDWVCPDCSATRKDFEPVAF